MKGHISLIGSVATALLFIVCNFGNNPQQAKELTINDLRIPPDTLPAWKDSIGYPVYSGDARYQFMDGGIQIYIDSGMVQVARQMFIKADSGEVAEARIMDFVTPANAARMFNYQKRNAATLRPVAGFPDSAAYVDLGTFVFETDTTSATAYAHFDRFYFEIITYGFTSGIGPAYSLIGTMLKYYSGKTAQ